MTEGLSRRDLVMLAGAGAALASRTPALLDSAVPSDTDCKRGHGDNWGVNPHDGPTYEEGKEPPGYHPAYIAIAIIDFDKRWSIDIHHASFAINPPAEADPENYRLDLAIDLIKWVAMNNKRLGDWSTHHTQVGKPDRIPHYRQKGNHKHKYHVSSFDDFKFKSQNEIFIFIRNKDIIIDKSWLLSFTRYNDGHTEMAKNYSFFRARALEGGSLGTLGNYGKLIRVENYVTNSDATPIVTDTVYSMNVHFKMKARREGTEQQRYIAMVVDPDTGNGQGNEP